MQLTHRGINEAISNLSRVQQGIASPEPMRQATQLVTRETRRNTPVDRGTTRASIMASIRSTGQVIEGVVGSNRKTALWAEKGTRPHWPPLAALEPWARRHGMTAYLVALSISRKGTKGHHMLENALEDNQRKIIQFFKDYNRKLVRDAG